MMDKIEQLIEEEVNRRVNQEMSEYIKLLSTKLHIPMEIMMKSLNTPTQTRAHSGCKGVKPNGQRCSRSGKNGGYCGHHVAQKEKNASSVRVMASSGHTHSVPPLYMEGCPECEKNKQKRSVKTGLIDCGLLDL